MQEDGVWIMDMQQHHVHYQKYWILNVQTDCLYIKNVLVLVHINMPVQEPDIVPVMVRYVMENIPNVIVLRFMIGLEVLVSIPTATPAQVGIQPLAQEW